MPSSETAEIAGWENYWKESLTGSCIPEHRGLAQVLESLWNAFALNLPKKGRLLDIGTGAGAVLRLIGKERPDLKLTGVDYASRLPAPAGRYKLKPGVRMEQLPFESAAFDGVSSQFAFEYGDMDKTAGELFRVLKPQGLVQLVVHCSDGPVLAQNRSRRDALHWAVVESGLFEQAANFAKARKLLRIGPPATFREAPMLAARRFPGQSAAAEVLAGLHGILIEHDRQSGDEISAGVNWLRARAMGEIATLTALQRAAQDEGGIEFLADLLRSAGFRIEPPAAVNDNSSGAPFAWIVRGAKITT